MKRIPFVIAAATCVLFGARANAVTTQTVGAGSAVTMIDRSATFDTLTSTTIVHLDVYSENGLSITTSGDSWAADLTSAPTLDPFHGANGTDRAFYAIAWGNNDWVTIQNTNHALMHGVEFMYGNTWTTGNIYGTYPWGNSDAALDWQTFSNGSLVSSGTITPPLGMGTVVGFSDPAGFDQLLVRSTIASSGDPTLQAIALDNLYVQLSDCSGVSNCSGHGACIGTNTCACNTGWSGAACDTPTCLAVNGCSAHGTCVAPDTCQCTPGWSGADCSTSVPAHDAVVLPVAPINVMIPSSSAPTATTASVKVKVRNADPSSETPVDSILLTAESVDCPAGVTIGAPDFLPSTPAADNPIAIPGGATRTAVVPVTVHDADFQTFNHRAPNRCTLRFTASTQVSGNVDPTPNNVVTAELNVIDANDAESSSPPHETVLNSLRPLQVIIGKQTASPVVKQIHPLVVNADILPAPDAGDAITVSVDPPSCPWIVAGSLDIDGKTPGNQNQTTLAGGKGAVGKLQLSVLPAAVTTSNAKSPARCTLVLHANGPSAPDPEPSNNQTTLTIDVVDLHDVP